jgi:MoxR-like ATPase
VTSLRPPHDATTPAEAIARFRQVHDVVLQETGQIIRGKDGVVRLALACLFAGGHLVIEDVPGTGKTSLAKSLAAAVAGSWRRVQFTPDLLPSDITGVSIWDRNAQEFRFRPGPVFANIVLADEINRASPKTQSALLEVMEERQVTVDGVAHPVPTPFLVVATQNPIDLEGTYQLPEAQLDRFLMRLAIGHPELDVEAEIFNSRATAEAPTPRQVTTLAEVEALQRAVASVHTAPEISRYIAVLVKATREHPQLRLGVSTRGGLALMRAAQAYAAGEGRHFVVPGDVKAVVGPVLTHRLMVTAQAEVSGVAAADVLTEVVGSVPVPVLSERR